MRIKLPDGDYILTCGRDLRVRQALHDKGIRWPYGESPLEHRLENQNLFIEDNCVRYVSALQYYIRTGRYPILSIEDIQEKTLNNAQVFVKFLKHHRMYSAWRRAVKEQDAPLGYRIHAGSIDQSLHWAVTKEGMDAWSKMNSKWGKLWKDLCLKQDNATIKDTLNV